MLNKVYIIIEDCRNSIEGYLSTSIPLIYSNRKQAQENMKHYVENQEQFIIGAKIVTSSDDFYVIETDFNGSGPLTSYSYSIIERNIDIPYE